MPGSLGRITSFGFYTVFELNKMRQTYHQFVLSINLNQKLILSVKMSFLLLFFSTLNRLHHKKINQKTEQVSCIICIWLQERNIANVS